MDVLVQTWCPRCRSASWLGRNCQLLRACPLAHRASYNIRTPNQNLVTLLIRPVRGEWNGGEEPRIRFYTCHAQVHFLTHLTRTLLSFINICAFLRCFGRVNTSRNSRETRSDENSPDRPSVVFNSVTVSDRVRCLLAPGYIIGALGWITTFHV